MKKLKNFLKNIRNILSFTRAAIALNIARWKADSLFAKTGKRFYVVWDSSRRMLVCISYGAIHGRADSYHYLRLRGCFAPQTRAQLQQGSLYYSRSKSSPAMTKECLQARMHTLVTLRARKSNKDTAKK